MTGSQIAARRWRLLVNRIKIAIARFTLNGHGESSYVRPIERVQPSSQLADLMSG
ncbi:hypothetical protein PAXRUDRAFT_471161 [Paxillus rubicundulus Ve08.2h10]|uniref:Uncharacterized protein n=1 Tax=Paxillus rubicundulus Ve08.2h10 TaxID=930991 RepID=A0A0D0E7L6_9AGAM|nr:hypothetical protein PAXRUDRAFT_471161 [Paxillus rubicundulus Ve08.2h10]